jgi:hypothetical protein
VARYGARGSGDGHNQSAERMRPHRRSTHALRDQRDQMKRFLIPVAIVIIILVGLALLTEGSAIPPFLYRVF